MALGNPNPVWSALPTRPTLNPPSSQDRRRVPAQHHRQPRVRASPHRRDVVGACFPGRKRGYPPICINFLYIVYFSDTRTVPRGPCHGVRSPGHRTGHVEAKHSARDGTSCTQPRRTEFEGGRRVSLPFERRFPCVPPSPCVLLLPRRLQPRPAQGRRALRLPGRIPICNSVVMRRPLPRSMRAPGDAWRRGDSRRRDRCSPPRSQCADFGPAASHRAGH